MWAFYHPGPMPSRPTLAAALAVMVWPAAAQAAELRVDKPCYADPRQRADVVQITGTGFTPKATYQLTLDGRPVTGGTSDADATGAFRGRLAAPSLSALGSAPAHAFTLGAQEGANAPTTRFTVSRLSADFHPSTGDLRNLRVRFTLRGFALGGRAQPPIYVHYIGPDGRLQATAKLGTGRGPCGSIPRTARRRLFPFRAAARGTWSLQVDTAKAYVRGTPTSPFLFVPLRVRVG